MDFSERCCVGASATIQAIETMRGWTRPRGRPVVSVSMNRFMAGIDPDRG
jgi:hypothetical protein